MKTLTIIGCGKVGRTLARLWQEAHVFRIQQILNRSLESGQAAVEFIGAGTAIASYEALRPADVFLIAASDASIALSADQLAASPALRADSIVFHCSGSLPAAVLASVQQSGARIASVHPIKSFAEPQLSAASFAGTYCGIEGDLDAVAFLQAAFESIGAIVFAVDAAYKAVYHAASVFACNYLVVLLEIGIRCYEKAGLSRDFALQLLQPIVAGTVKNVFTLGTVQALTGPIARGDAEVVARQCDALADWDKPLANLYKRLGQYALELSADQGNASLESLALLRDILLVNNRNRPTP